MKIKFKKQYFYLLSPLLDILTINDIFTELSQGIVLNMRDLIEDSICIKITGKPMTRRMDIFEIHKFAQMW